MSDNLAKITRNSVNVKSLAFKNASFFDIL